MTAKPEQRGPEAEPAPAPAASEAPVRRPGRIVYWVGIVFVIAKESFRSFDRNRNWGAAAALAYYGFLALMPLFLLAVFLLGTVMSSSEAVLAAMTDLANRLFPQFNTAILGDVTTLANDRVWGVLSLAVLLLSIVPFASAFRDAVSRIIKPEREVSFIKAKLLDLAAALALLLLFIAMAGGKFLAAFAAERIGSSPLAALSPALLLVPFAGTVLVVAFFYRVLSPVRLSWGQVLAGAVTAAVLLFAIRPVFGLVLAVNPDYGYTFGSLKAIFLLLVWVDTTFSAVLLGAEVLANVRRRDAIVLRSLFISGSPASRRSRLLERFTTAHEPGEVIFREGDPGGDLHVVMAGEVVLTLGSRALRTLVPGEYFGEMSMLIGSPRTATAAVGSAGARLARVSRETFELLLRENPGIMQSVLAETTRRLRRTNERFDESNRLRDPTS